MKLSKKLLVFIIAISLLLINNITAFADTQYYLGGFALGFDLNGEGAYVVGLSEVICADDVYLPAREAGIKTGDYILSINGKKINTAEDIDNVLKNYSDGGLIVEVLSNEEKSIKHVYPKKDLSGKYKIGVLIRDYLSGIGTVTLINSNGEFVSLGHPIVDEEGSMLQVGGGDVYNCKIIGVIKGERGRAGELSGTILRNQVIGTAYRNSEVGLFGKITHKEVLANLQKISIGEPMPGNAFIYTTVNGLNHAKYTISIVKVIHNEKNNKDLVIKVTDERLIEYTGGIVQGMSGSPIVQDGKLVGAVTHVFLNDSTRGYGISIQKMINYN